MKKYIVILFLFTILSFFMTYPLIFCLSDTLVEESDRSYDPLLNSWILGWNISKIKSFEFSSLFDTNTFYPHKNTLAYTEHMIGSTVLALPISYFTDNPILQHNILILLGFVFSGFTMYLLVVYITKNHISGFIAGCVFTFWPWRMSHVMHLQLIAAQWVPLTFLTFHIFLKKRTYKSLVIFILCFVMQFLSCGYYGIFLSFFIGIFFLIEYSDKLKDKQFYFQVFLFGAISGIFLLPILYKYILVKKTMGFQRTLAEIIYFSADILAYISAPKTNWFWGGITKNIVRPEGALFLGLFPIILLLIGVFFYYKKTFSKNYTELTQTSFLLSIHKFLTIALCLLTLLFLLSFFRISIPISNKVISFHNTKKISAFFWCVLGIKLLLKQNFRIFLRKLFQPKLMNYYFLMLTGSIIFSYGPIIFFNCKEVSYGPYALIKDIFPGLSGLRVPARFAITFSLAASVFIGCALDEILKKFHSFHRKTLFVFLLCTIIFVEYLSFPSVFYSVKKVPEVYEWLSKDKKSYAIIEMPLPRSLQENSKDAFPMYYSLFHKKYLVNGYSGYTPFAYYYLYTKGVQDFPSEYSLNFIQEFDVKYILIHSDKYPPKVWENIQTSLLGLNKKIRFIKQFESTYVYECIQTQKRVYKEIYLKKARAYSNKGTYPYFAIDNDSLTLWSTINGQLKGTWFALDMRKETSISKIGLSIGKHLFHYPRNFKLEGSVDGKKWFMVKNYSNRSPAIRSYIQNKHDIEFSIEFPTIKVRFFRITITKTNKEINWKIKQVKLFLEQR